MNVEGRQLMVFIPPDATWPSDFEEGSALILTYATTIHALLDRLQLRCGQRLLEIGCGWGSLAEIAAREATETARIVIARRNSPFR